MPSPACGSRFALSLAGPARARSCPPSPCWRQRRSRPADSRARRPKRRRPAPAGQRPNFVVIQTDDQTLDSSTRRSPRPAARRSRRCRTRSRCIAEKGVTFNRYYVLLPALLPVAGQPADRPLRAQQQRPRQRPAERRLHRLQHAAPPTPTTSPPGCRAPATGRSTSASSSTATATSPTTTAPTCRPAGTPGTRSSSSDTNHYFYGYTLNNNGTLDGPFGDSGSWDTREYGERDDPGCPTAPLNGKPCCTRPTSSTGSPPKSCYGTSPEQPFYLQLDYTAPHGDFRRPAGPEPATRHYGSFAGAPLPAQPRRRASTRATSTTSPASSAKPPTSRRPKSTPTASTTRSGLESLRSIDEGVKQIVDTLGAMRRLRNTYIIFTSDNGFFFGEHRLTGGKFLAYEPSTHLPLLIRGPGIKPGTSTGELAVEHRHRADDPRTGRSRRRQEHRRPLAGALHERHRTCAPGGRSSSSPSSRPTTSKQNGGATAESTRRPAPAPRRQARPSELRASSGGESAAERQRLDRGAAEGLRGIRLGPYKYIEWPDGEKELYDINKDPYELNNIVRDPNYFPIRAFLHNELRRLEECTGRTCQERPRNSR